MLVNLFVAYVSLASLTSTSALQEPSLQAATHQVIAEDTVVDQVDTVRAILPPEVHFDITRGGPQPSADLIDTASLYPLSGSVGCISSTPIPPNTYDCDTLIAIVFHLNKTLVVPPQSCSWITYRSCVMYNCASLCEGFSYDTAEWFQGLDNVRRGCVYGMGRSGFFYRLPSHEKADYPYVAGIENAGGLHVRIPPFWPCVIGG